MMKRTIGGDRLGSGKKMTVDLKTYNRSTHDLGYIWRSTMAPGTLVPFMSEVALPGDTFDIDLDCQILTHPTVGPLFGSYKVQLDTFICPIRLYQGQLHNNKLGIGLNMSQIKLPLINMVTTSPTPTKNMDNQQVNPSCILAYLGIRGNGQGEATQHLQQRTFNALPYLSYWDIYKNYYANKQEEIGAVIHNAPVATARTIDDIQYASTAPEPAVSGALPENPTTIGVDVGSGMTLSMDVNYTGTAPLPSQVLINTDLGEFQLDQLFLNIVDSAGTLYCTNAVSGGVLINWRYADSGDLAEQVPEVVTFPLSNIDQMREDILADVADTNAFLITRTSIEPYGLPFEYSADAEPTEKKYSKNSSLEGLALKTYQSDLFNNWIQTEWLDGTNGINEITSIDTSGGSFTIDTLNLSKKVYDMLNRIAISGGTYDDWLDTVYTHERRRGVETPMYMGGLIKELVFQEVISNAEATSEAGTQPLGTLAGKGIMSKKHKGGKVTIKVDEPSYIIGIVSLTPRVDYSQGNKWDVRLETMDDFHKPALDEIGFQDLITDQMCWTDSHVPPTNVLELHSAGKQPAWMNYMTNVNKTYGNFAIQGNEMFMTLNRRYETYEQGHIKDLTTYIDPIKFNDIFAQTSRDAQNFWVQIGVDITARRKMSAKVIPNL